MKKILALLLASMMLLTLVACDDGPDIPIDDAGSDSGAGSAADSDTEGGEDTEDPGDDYYEPDPDAKYGGFVGVGVESGTAYFDDLQVMSKQADRRTLLTDELEGELPAFTYGAGSAADWSIVVDPTEAEDAEEPNHALMTAAAGSMAYLGESNWNYYQYRMKVLAVDADTVIKLYFCITDANNYYVLSIGENGGEEADCYQVVNGEATSVATKVYAPLTVGEWTSVGITVEREVVDIYIGGTQRFSLFNEEYEYSMSIATRATVNAPFCASWETPGSINDGMWPEATFLGSSGGTAYGSWSMAGTTETISYEWDEAVTVDGIGLFFWRDKDTREYWLENGGICGPAAYTIQYLDENGEYVDVTNGEGYGVDEDVMNKTFFDAVTTTSIQVTLIKFTDAEAGTYGFENYQSYVDGGGDTTAEGAPQDPSIRGMGLFEFEVYAAGTVERPEAE